LIKDSPNDGQTTSNVIVKECIGPETEFSFSTLILLVGSFDL